MTEQGSDQLRHAQWAGCAIVLVWLVVNAIWLRLDQRPPIWDSAHHARVVFEAAHTATQGSLWDVVKTVSLHTVYPPLGYLVSIPAVWIARDADVLILWGNIIFGALLGWSLWGLSRSIASPWIGVGAILLTFCQWLIVAPSRTFMMDFPLAAMVTWALWRVLALYRRPTARNAVLLGISVGAGLMLKWSFLLYVTPALAWIGFEWMRARSDATSLRLMAIAAVVALLTSGWWYAWRWSELMVHIQENLYFSQVWEGDPSGRSVQGWLYYAREYQSCIPILSYFGAAGLLLLRGPRMARVIVLWCVVAYLLLVAAANKQERFLVPLVPLMSLVTWWGLARVRSVWLRRGTVALAACWCVAQLAVLSSHGAARLLPVWYLPVLQGVVPIQVLARAAIFHAQGAPMADQSLLTPVVDYLDELATSEPVNVLVLIEDQFHTPVMWGYEASRRGLRMKFYGADTVRGSWSLSELARHPHDAILVRNPVVSSPWAYLDQNFRVLTQQLLVESDAYQLGRSLPIPGGGVLEVHVRRGAQPDGAG